LVAKIAEGFPDRNFITMNSPVKKKSQTKNTKKFTRRTHCKTEDNDSNFSSQTTVTQSQDAVSPPRDAASPQRNATKSKRNHRRQVRQPSTSSSSSDPGNNEDTSPNSEQVTYRRDLYWGSKRRPSHFFAIRLTDSNLLATVRALHKRILSIEPSYEQCLIPLERLHLTLCNVRLPQNESSVRVVEHSPSGISNSAVQCGEQHGALPCLGREAPVELSSSDETVSISRKCSDNLCQTSADNEIDAAEGHLATEALNRLLPELRLNTQDLKITLEGIAHFSNSTLYAKVKDEDGRLRYWIDRLRMLIKREGFEELEVFSFTAHVTLLKITRSQIPKLKTRYIDGRVLADLEDVSTIGQQKLSMIEICEKSSRFSEVDGFYKSVSKLSLE
jgi:hypothetical protein